MNCTSASVIAYPCLAAFREEANPPTSRFKTYWRSSDTSESCNSDENNHSSQLAKKSHYLLQK